MSKKYHNPGVIVLFPDGRRGIVYKQDQFKTFRCGSCGAPIRKDGKVLVRMIGKGLEELDEPKRLVNYQNTHLRTLGFV